MIIKNTQVRQFLQDTGGKFFTVEFIKKNGEVRQMNARTGVAKHLAGGKLKFDPDKLDLLTVFDIQKKEYRMINLNTVRWIKFQGKQLYVSD